MKTISVLFVIFFFLFGCELSTGEENTPLSGGEGTNNNISVVVGLDQALALAEQEVSSQFDSADLVEISGHHLVKSLPVVGLGYYTFWFDAWGDNSETVHLDVLWDGTIPSWATCPMGPCPFNDLSFIPDQENVKVWTTFYKDFGGGVMHFTLNHFTDQEMVLSVGEEVNVTVTLP